MGKRIKVQEDHKLWAKGIHLLFSHGIAHCEGDRNNMYIEYLPDKVWVQLGDVNTTTWNEEESKEFM